MAVSNSLGYKRTLLPVFLRLKHFTFLFWSPNFLHFDERVNVYTVLGMENNLKIVSTPCYLNKFRDQTLHPKM